jgi:hypothetical protein
MPDPIEREKAKHAAKRGLGFDLLQSLIKSSHLEATALSWPCDETKKIKSRQGVDLDIFAAVAGEPVKGWNTLLVKRGGPAPEALTA